MMREKKHHKRIIIILAVLLISAAGVLVFNVFANRHFETTYYRLFSDKLKDSLKMVVIADIHQTYFCEDNRELMEAVKAEEPDIIIMAGDCINNRDPDIDYIVELCEKLVDIAPVYFGLGNHELDVIYGSGVFLDPEEAEKFNILDIFKGKTELSEGNDELLERINEVGVHVLHNSSEFIAVNGSSIKIGGLSTNENKGQRYLYSFVDEDTDIFKILICHKPQYVMEHDYENDIDLVLSGHNHGGQIRLPFVGGVLSPDSGLFPEFDGGYFTKDHVNMIVSRGLGSHIAIPRINNKPELVVVSVN